MHGTQHSSGEGRVHPVPSHRITGPPASSWCSRRAGGFWSFDASVPCVRSCAENMFFAHGWLRRKLGFSAQVKSLALNLNLAEFPPARLLHQEEAANHLLLTES